MDDKLRTIRIEKIKLLYLHSLTPAILSGVASGFLVAALWSSANHTHLLIWLGITIFFAAFRIGLILKFKQANPQCNAVLAWEKPFSASLIIVFLSWSLGLILIMPRDNLSAVFILNTFSIGLAGAAISWYSPLRYLQMTTISLALVPMIIVLLTLGHQETFWVGIAACCMYVSCMITSVLLQKTFNGNLELAYDLETAKKHAEHLANIDGLTQLDNRRAFLIKAETLFAYCQRNNSPISAMVLDVDHFKKSTTRLGIQLAILPCATWADYSKPICANRICRAAMAVKSLRYCYRIPAPMKRLRLPINCESPWRSRPWRLQKIMPPHSLPALAWQTSGTAWKTCSTMRIKPCISPKKAVATK